MRKDSWRREHRSRTERRILLEEKQERAFKAERTEQLWYGLSVEKTKMPGFKFCFLEPFPSSVTIGWSFNLSLLMESLRRLDLLNYISYLE